MGNTCNGTSSLQQQVKQLPLIKEQSRFFRKRITMSDRFRQQVQKLKIDGPNIYKLILPVEGERQQSKVIQCKFLFSHADLQVCPQYQFVIEDMQRFPIIDAFQPQQTINPQVYHKITTIDKRRKLMKYYNFTSFNDYELKKALYQLSLYKRLPVSSSRLQNYFVIYKGDLKQLVIILDYSYVSLHDVMYYRQKASYQWEEMEILLIMKMLCKGVMQLHQAGIIHRDVRPSTVFFSPLRIINSGQPDMYSSPQIIKAQQMQQQRFYHFVNLQSARVIDPLQPQQHTDLLTVKGVPMFTENPIRQALQRQQHKANYNGQQADIIGLKNTLVSMVNLQPTNVGSNHNERLRQKSRVKQLVSFMSNHKVSIEKVAEKVDVLLGIGSVAKPQWYYNVMRTFYTKELTICQNIETNLYYQNLQRNYGITNLQLKNTYSNLNASSRQSLALSTQQALTPPPNNYIQTLYMKTLYDLQKKEVFVPFMLQKLGKNFQTGKKEQNVGLLIKVGRFFEDAGVRENQYYKEAILLLLQLAEGERLQGFYKDHQRLVTQAQDVYGKFMPQSKMVTRGRCMLLKQMAYRELLKYNDLSPTQLISLNPFAQLSTRTNFTIIQKCITQSYQLATKSNLPFQQQLQLIYSKAELYLMMQRLQQSEISYLTGYEIATKNQKQFLTSHNSTKYKGMFEYGLALVDLLKLSNKIIQKSPRILFNVQEKLEKAKLRFSSVTVHPVLVIKCYMAMGNLGIIKEDMQMARLNFQKALNLVHAENQTSIDGTRVVSARMQLQIVQKLINVLTFASNNIQARKYQQLHDALKKQFGKSRKTQNRYSRKGKPTSKSNQLQAKSSQELLNIPLNLPVIRQEEEDNRVFDSERKINTQQGGGYMQRESQINVENYIEGESEINIGRESQINPRREDHVFQF